MHGKLPGKSGAGETYAWYVCGALLLAYIFSFLDRSIIALLVEPIEHDLGITDTEMSLLQGFSFAIFYALLGLPIARLVDARSRRGVIAAGIVVWSVMTAACGLASRFWVLFAARVGVGAGEAALLPGAASMMADYFPPHRRGLALGVFATGIFLGGGGALIIGGQLVRQLSGVEIRVPVLGLLHPWQLVFFAVGLPGVLVAGLIMLSVREPARTGGRTVSGGLPIGEVFDYMLRNIRAVACHNLGFTLLALASYAASAWVPTIFIRTHGWNAGQIGTYFGILLLAFGPAGSVLGGWLGDRMLRRGRRDAKLRVGMLAALGSIPFAIAFPLVASPFTAIALMVPFLIFVSFVWGLAPAALQEMVPNQMRGVATAIYTGIINLIGLGLGSLSVALVADHVLQDPAKLNVAMAIVAPIALAAAALLFWLGLKPFVATLDQAADWSPRREA